MCPAPPADRRRTQPFLKQVFADSEYVALIDASGRKPAVDFARTNRPDVDFVRKHLVSTGIFRKSPDRYRICVPCHPPSDAIGFSYNSDRRRFADNRQIDLFRPITTDSKTSAMTRKRKPLNKLVRHRGLFDHPPVRRCRPTLASSQHMRHDRARKIAETPPIQTALDHDLHVHVVQTHHIRIDAQRKQNRRITALRITRHPRCFRSQPDAVRFKMPWRASVHLGHQPYRQNQRRRACPPHSQFLPEPARTARSNREGNYICDSTVE